MLNLFLALGIIVLAVVKMLRVKQTATPNINMPPPTAPSRTVNLRMIVLPAISFFIGLQFKDLMDLFGPSVGDDVNIGITNRQQLLRENGWAPDDIIVSNMPKRRRRQKEAKTQVSNGADDKVQRDAPPGRKQQSPNDISLNRKYLKYLQSLDPIPKKVHIFFPDKNYWRKGEPIPFVEHSILSLMKLNPEWNVTVYDDDMVDDIIRKGADSNIIPMEESKLLLGIKDDDGRVIQRAAHIVERSDIARLILMYTEGGFYIDADRLISKKISDVLHDNTRLCLPTFNDVNFCQDLMCTARHNKLFLSMINDATNIRLPQKRREGWIKGGSLFDLGPVLYNRHIFIHVFGGDESTYEKIRDEKVSVPRQMLESSSDGIIVTKKETGCDDGLLVDDNLSECYERDTLYNKYNMNPWGQQVDALWAGSDKGSGSEDDDDSDEGSGSENDSGRE